MDYRQNDVDQNYNQQQNQHPNYNDPLPPFPPYPPYMAPKTNGKSIAALVLGILSIMLPYIGFIIGIVAIIFAALSLKEIKVRMEQGKGLAIAGLVCGIIGTLIYALIILFLIILVVFFADTSSTLYSY